MKIHYLNAKGEEVFLDGIMHLQNVDNYTWIAATKSGKELTLKTERIEGIADMHLIEKQEGAKVRPSNLTISDIEDFAQRACVQLCPELTQKCISIITELLSYKQLEASGLLSELRVNKK